MMRVEKIEAPGRCMQSEEGAFLTSPMFGPQIKGGKTYRMTIVATYYKSNAIQP